MKRTLEELLYLTLSPPAQSIAQWDLARLFHQGQEVEKYDPDQPRHPKGHPDGGKWKATGTGSAKYEQAVRDAREEALAWGARTGNEKLVAVDAEGNKVFSKGGNKSSVEFTDEMEARWSKGDVADTIVHNHPKMYSLSLADIGATAYPGVKLIEAVGRDGPGRIIFRGALKKYKMPEALHNSDWKEVLEQSRGMLAHHLQGFKDQAHKIYDPIIRPNVVNGGLTFPEANLLASHLTMEALRVADIIDYEVVDSDGLLSRVINKAKGMGLKDDISDKLRVSLKEGSPTYSEYHNQWGVLERIAGIAGELSKQDKTKIPYLLVDPPVQPYSPRNELLAWKKELESMPEFIGRATLLDEVNQYLAEVQKYDPDQPRAPKGSEIGGQWVATGAGGTTTEQDEAAARTAKYREDELRKRELVLTRKLARHIRDMSDQPNGPVTEEHLAQAREQIAQANAELKRIFDDSEIVINRSRESTLAKIYQAGRFQTQFETEDSSGLYDPDFRAIAEQGLFGLSADYDDRDWTNDVPPEHRPVYGFLTDKTTKGTGVASNYGYYQFVLKDSVRDRVTATVGDSLTGTEDSRANRFIPAYQPSPVKYPNFASVVSLAASTDTGPDEVAELASRVRHGTYHDPEGIKRLIRIDPDSYSRGYVEAQIHGGVRLEDIKALRVPARSNMHRDAVVEGLLDLYREAGVEVEYYDGFYP